MAETILQHEIRTRMIAQGFNQKSLARAASLNETAVRDILKGRSRNPRIDTLEALARTLGCAVQDLTGYGEPARIRKRTNQVDVVGAVEADSWQYKLVRSTDEWYRIDIPKDPRFHSKPLYALEVRGDARLYKDGDVVICLATEDVGRDLAHGDRLVIQRSRGDRKAVFLIGEYHVDNDGQARILIGSGDIDQAGELVKADAPDVTAIAIIVGSFRKE